MHSIKYTNMYQNLCVEAASENAQEIISPSQAISFLSSVYIYNYAQQKKQEVKKQGRRGYSWLCLQVVMKPQALGYP